MLTLPCTSIGAELAAIGCSYDAERGYVCWYRRLDAETVGV